MCTQTILCGLFPSEEEAARQHDRVAQHLAATKPSVGQACSLRIPFATSHPLTTSLGRPNGVISMADTPLKMTSMCKLSALLPQRARHGMSALTLHVRPSAAKRHCRLYLGPYRSCVMYLES